MHTYTARAQLVLWSCKSYVSTLVSHATHLLVPRHLPPPPFVPSCLGPAWPSPYGPRTCPGRRSSSPSPEGIPQPRLQVHAQQRNQGQAGTAPAVVLLRAASRAARDAAQAWREPVRTVHPPVASQPSPAQPVPALVSPTHLAPHRIRAPGRALRPQSPARQGTHQGTGVTHACTVRVGRVGPQTDTQTPVWSMHPARHLGCHREARGFPGGAAHVSERVATPASPKVRTASGLESSYPP